MYDVAIIGGGPAAIFAAYEFVLKYPALKLVMLEAGNAIDKLQRKAAIILLSDGGNRRIAANIHLLLQKFIDIFHDYQVVFCAQVTHLSVEQMQIVTQSLATNIAILGSEILARSSMATVELVHIVD